MGYENFRIGAGSLTVDGVDVGDTTPDGIVINYEPEVHLHMSGRHGNTPVKASLIGVTLTLQITIGETTLANLQKVLAGATLDGSDKVDLGIVAGQEIAGVPLVMTPNDGTPNWNFRNAVVTSSVEVAYQVANERVYQVTFTGMIDEDAPDASALAYVS